MKVKILKKMIKEGDNYCIKSLFVSFTEKETFEKIVSHLVSKGAASEQIERFCKPNEYNGNVSYAFNLNCSHYTFDKVERFGLLDANIIFGLNDKGYINARIEVKERIEQVNNYEEPEDQVSGWAAQHQQQIPPPTQQQAQVKQPVTTSYNQLPELPAEIDDSPF